MPARIAGLKSLIDDPESSDVSKLDQSVEMKKLIVHKKVDSETMPIKLA